MSATTAMIGDDCVFSNNVMIAGHVTVGEFVICGGGAAVVQFARVGSHAFVGGMTGLAPISFPSGSPSAIAAYLTGLN